MQHAPEPEAIFEPTPASAGAEGLDDAFARRWLGAIAAAGILCRAVQYLWDRSFWVDEASLVLNIRTKTAMQLLGPLDYHQAAPPLFLLAERGVYHLLGGSEWALRSLPVLLGCVSVLLFARLANRLLSPWAAVPALAVFAFSDRLVWHSVEVKQYGTDVFVALLLLTIAVGRRTQTDRPVQRLLPLSLAAAACVWFSYPAALVFGGLSLAMLPATFRRGWKPAMLYVLCNLLVVVSFALLLRFVVRVQQTGSLESYWVEHFVDLRHPLSWPEWVGRHLLSLFNYPAQPMGIVLLALALFGVYGLVRDGRYGLLGMLIYPIGLNLLAAAAHRYPFDGERLTAYLLPSAILLSGFGTEVLRGWAPVRQGAFAVAPAAAVALCAACVAAWHLAVPQFRSHIRPAAGFVRAHGQPGDGIYVLSQREFECYWPAGDPHVRFDLDWSDRIPFQRFWVIAGYPNDAALRRLGRVRSWAREFASEKRSFADRGGVAWRFELRPVPRPHLPPPDISTHHKMMNAGPGAD